MNKIRMILAAIGVALFLAAPALALEPTDQMIRTSIALTETYDLPAGLLLAVAETESGFDPNCRTGRCCGLMQIHSAYAAEFAEATGLESFDLFDPDDSMTIAASMLSGYLERYEGDLHFVLMAYNLGEYGAKVRRRDGVSSTGYSRKVISRLEKWADVTVEEEPELVEETVETVEEAAEIVKPSGDSEQLETDHFRGFTKMVRAIHEWIREVLFR